MKNLLALLLLILSVTVANAQGNWCEVFKSIPNLVDNDVEKLRGKLLFSDEMYETYQCPIKVEGADFVETKFFSGGGRFYSVTAYYATGVPDAEGEKIYQRLVTEFKKCFPKANHIAEAYYHNCNDVWGYADEGAYHAFVVGTPKNNVTDPNHKQRSYARISIEY